MKGLWSLCTGSLNYTLSQRDRLELILLLSLIITQRLFFRYMQIKTSELSTRHPSVHDLPLFEVSSPRAPYSPRVYCYRKNSLSLKQKPIPLSCLEEQISRLDVVHDSLVHETRAILDLMNGPAQHKASHPNMHRLKAKEPLTSRTNNDKDNTCSTICEAKPHIDEPKFALRTLRTTETAEPTQPTEHSHTKQSNEIEDTMEYQKWISRHRHVPSRLDDNKQNIAKNCKTPRQVNIFVKFVDKSCLKSTNKKNRVAGKSTKPTKKRCNAIP